MRDDLSQADTSYTCSYPAVSEYIYRCSYCDTRESWSTEAAAQAAASWHVYDQHRAVWVTVIGSDRVPRDLAPATLGRHLDGSERQV